MALEPGQMLSHYRLVEKIGEGGMGVVWKARDQKLHREVALKALPTELVRAPERRRRLVHEARATAAFNHPNIATIHEIDEAEGQVFFAMELVEGKSLRSLIGGRLLSIRESLRIAAEVADGLASAHAARFIHRDLKPENVMVRSDGHVKILDFGLAKIQQEGEAPCGSSLHQAKTRTDELTRQGGVLGTAAYMSPEQARGEALDTRTDVFSFGSMLYEMVAGRAPFHGKSATDVLSAILRDQPAAPSVHNPEVPPELESIVGKCLEKEARDRYQHADELAGDLRKLRQVLESGSPATATPSRGVFVPSKEEARAARRSWRWSVVVGSAALVGTLLTLVVWQVTSRTDAGADARTLMILPLEVRGQKEGADYVGRAFAEALAVNLAQDESLQVLPVPEPSEIESGGAVTRSRAAREVGAGRLLIGALTREGERLRASLSLVDASANRVIWGAETSGDDLSSLVSSLARQVATELGVATAKRYDSPYNSTANPALADSPLYTEALAAVRTVLDTSTAVSVTERLIEAFPDEPDAHALRVWVLALEAAGTDPSSPQRRAFQRALAVLDRVDPENPWGDYVRAFWFDARPLERIEQVTQILQRDDLTPAAQAFLLTARAGARVRIGDPVAGFQDLEAARRLDPASDELYPSYSVALTNSGRPNEGLARARQAIALNPVDLQNHSFLGWALDNLERWEEAASAYEKPCDAAQSEPTCSFLALALHEAGEKDRAREIAERAAGMEDASWGTYFIAAYWALAGDRARAIDLLRRYFERSKAANLPIHMHRAFNSLRGDPEFESLVAERWRDMAEYYENECRAVRTQDYCSRYALSLQKSGRELEARKAAEEAAPMTESIWGHYQLAQYHALAGNRAEAVDHLKRYLAFRDGGNPEILTNLDFASLRGDSRFEAIVAEVEARRKEASVD